MYTRRVIKRIQLHEDVSFRPSLYVRFLLAKSYFMITYFEECLQENRGLLNTQMHQLAFVFNYKCIS